MDLLIVKLSALGDVLRTTSLLRPLRARHPGGRIWWLCSEQALPLLQGNPFLHALRTPKQGLPTGARFDLALSLEEDARAARLARESCAGELVGVTESGGRLGFTESSRPYYGMSLLNRDPDGSSRTADALKAANRLGYARLWLRILGLQEPPDPAELRPVLILSGEESESALVWARRNGLEPGQAVGCNPGAGKRWPSKQLSPERAAAMLDELAALGRPLILFGGPEEVERNRRILELTRARVLAPGTLGLRDFAARVALCGALVSTDSLAFHAATALGVPVAALVGPTSAAELDCFGRGEVLAAPGGCSCFYQARCREETSCLDRMPAAPAAAAISRLLRA